MRGQGETGGGCREGVYNRGPVGLTRRLPPTPPPTFKTMVRGLLHDLDSSRPPGRPLGVLVSGRRSCVGEEFNGLDPPGALSALGSGIEPFTVSLPGLYPLHRFPCVAYRRLDPS